MPLADLKRKCELNAKKRPDAEIEIYSCDDYDWADISNIIDHQKIKPTLRWINIYYNPDHIIAGYLRSLRRHVKKEIKNSQIMVCFVRLSKDGLEQWTPFATKASAEYFLKVGFASATGSFDPNAPAMRLPRGNPAHHEVQKVSLRALHCLVVLTEAALVADKYIQRYRLTLSKKNRRAATWLPADRGNALHFLTQVCGREMREGPKEDEQDIPLVYEKGMLWACRDFSIGRIVYPSYNNTSRTAITLGEKQIEGVYGMTPLEIRRQVAFELSNCCQHIGGNFDLAGAALWLCQNIMMMRISTEDLDRRFSRLFSETQSESEVRKSRNFRLGHKISVDYDIEESVPLGIVDADASLERRLLTIFHGGAVSPITEFNIKDDTGSVLDGRWLSEWSQVEALTRWIGKLRRTRQATMEAWTSFRILDLVDLNHEDGSIRLSALCHDERSWYRTSRSDALLTAMLPQACWRALIEAALHREQNAGDAFSVSYELVSSAKPCPQGDVDLEASRVALVGPLLMLPLDAAEMWAKRARSLPDQDTFYHVPAPSKR